MAEDPSRATLTDKEECSLTEDKSHAVATRGIGLLPVSCLIRSESDVVDLSHTVACLAKVSH